MPKLRFPEFESGGEWEDTSLGDKDVLVFVNDKTTIEKLNLDTYVSTENILQNFQGIKKSTKLPRTGSFTKFSKGDILMANIRPYLKKVWFTEFDGTASNDVLVFRAQKRTSGQYLKQILKNDKFINFVMIAAKGVKMPRGDKQQILTYPIAIPKPKEQQRIADCLSSLDEIIEVANEKLNLLKAHKKGLLQQLFPVAGEKVPKLRFQEFENDGDWNEKLIEEYFNVGSSKRVLQKDWLEKGIPFFRTRELVSLTKKEKFGSDIYISEDLFNHLSIKYGIPKEGDFLVSGVGTLGIAYQVKKKF